MIHTVSKIAPAAGLGALTAWAWNGLFPGYAMTPEVAVAMSAMLVPIFAYLAAFLPEPSMSGDGDKPSATAMGFKPYPGRQGMSEGGIG